MMKSDDVSPRARNHYIEEDYFSLNVRSGIIRSPIGTRMVGIPEELIAGLHAGLEEETGAAAGVVLYGCGRWWGKQFVRRHGLEIRHFYGMEAADLPLHFYSQVLRRVWAMYGWGALDMNLDLRGQGFVEFGVQSAMYSDVVGNIGRTSDYIIAGVLASIVSDLSGRELECVEITCRSKGDQRCAFLTGLGSRVDIVSQWVKQGRSRSEIVAAITSNTLA